MARLKYWLLETILCFLQCFIFFIQTVTLFNGGSIPSLATKNPMRNQTYPSDIGEGRYDDDVVNRDVGRTKPLG